MPPAFNLSQDQTLQLKSSISTSNSIDVGLVLPSVSARENKTYCRVSTLSSTIPKTITQQQPRPPPSNSPGTQNPSAHTYRLSVVKEQAAWFEGPLCISG